MAESLKKQVTTFLEEDGIFDNQSYYQALPDKLVKCRLKLKSDLLLAGLPWFETVFAELGTQIDLTEKEGMRFSAGEQLQFQLSFRTALLGERVALNLLQRASSIASFTQKFVQKTQRFGIKVLDTRKTLPGYRALDKYATQVGGAFNHRFSQTDAFMVKDNHKSFFGGLKAAVEFFQSLNSFYTPLIVEIHQLAELEEGIKLGLKHFLLDNFSLQEIQKLKEYKQEGLTFELSGGINLENIEEKLEVSGNAIDAVSIGSLTYGAPPVDISLKYE